MSNVVDLPFGINESEKLTRVIIDAVSAHYRSQGKTDEKGRASVPPRRMLRALAAISGQILFSAPEDKRSDAFAEFVADAKEHARLA